MGALLAGATSGLRCPEEANLRAPESVVAVHASYIRAGAELIETNTFGANRRKLAAKLLDQELEAINSAAVRLAREAREVSGRDVWIAGAIGPLGELEVFDANEHGPLYAEQAGVLEGRGVDLFMIETFFDLDELVSAVEAVRAVSSLPIVALLTFDDEAEVAGGVEASAAAARLRRARCRCDRHESRRRPACSPDGARCDAWPRSPARSAPEHRPREHRRRSRGLSALDARSTSVTSPRRPSLSEPASSVAAVARHRPRSRRSGSPSTRTARRTWPSRLGERHEPQVADAGVRGDAARSRASRAATGS